jgi:hypothetical protein
MQGSGLIRLRTRRDATMSRSLASHFVVLVVGLTLGVGAVAVAQRDTPAQPAATDQGVVKELRKLQGLIGTSQYDSGSLRDDLRRQLGFSSSPTIEDTLRDICRNTSTSSFGC